MFSNFWLSPFFRGEKRCLVDIHVLFFFKHNVLFVAGVVLQNAPMIFFYTSSSAFSLRFLLGFYDPKLNYL
jgi:hypothetical protein